MAQFRGKLKVDGDGTYQLFDPSSGEHVRGIEADRLHAIPEQVGDDDWDWTVDVEDETGFARSAMTNEQWAGLFDHPAGVKGEIPSNHNSWCVCSTKGMPGGVCTG